MGLETWNHLYKYSMHGRASIEHAKYKLIRRTELQTRVQPVTMKPNQALMIDEFYGFRRLLRCPASCWCRKAMLLMSKKTDLAVVNP